MKWCMVVQSRSTTWLGQKRKREHQKKSQKRIFCAHCETYFFAKPTLRKKKGVFALNHACNGGKRKQYVLGTGRKHRMCQTQHPGSCLRFSPVKQAMTR